MECGTSSDAVALNRWEARHIPYGKWHPVTGPRNASDGHEPCNWPPKVSSLFKDTLSTDNGLDIRNSPEGPTDRSLRSESGSGHGDDHSAPNLALPSECLPFTSDRHERANRHSDWDEVGWCMSEVSCKCHVDKSADRLLPHKGHKDSNEHS